jgi:hypothetical protein
MTNLRELLDADRDNLLDVVDWLAAMPQESFDKHVQQDVTGKLDQVAAAALRHRTNLYRWSDTLAVLVKDMQDQLADPQGKTPEQADWRRRALKFQTGVLHRHNEAQELVRRVHQQKPTAEARAASKTARKDAGERAIKRLIAAHRTEFVGYIAQEYAADGIHMPDVQYRELRDLATREHDGAVTS